MSFEIQELPDVIKIVTLLELQDRKKRASRINLVSRLDRSAGVICVSHPRSSMMLWWRWPLKASSW